MNKSFNNTQFLLNCTDEFLTKIDVPKMEDNPHFHPSEFNHEDHMEFKAFSENSVVLTIKFNDYGVEFGMEELDEVYSWSFDDVKCHRSDYDEILNNLILCEIKIKRCAIGFNYIFIKKEGLWLEYGRPFNGLIALMMFPLSYIPFDCKETEYQPLIKM